MPKRAHVCREKATNGRTAPPTGYHHASTVAVSSIHMPSRYARKAPALHVCVWFRGIALDHWIVEEEQAMLPDPLRRKRADCALLNPQKDTTPKSGHKRTQIDHPAPPMVPTGQQLTTYLAVEWTAMQAIGSWLFLLLLLGLGTRRGDWQDKKGTPPKRRSSAMSASCWHVRQWPSSGHELSCHEHNMIQP